MNYLLIILIIIVLIALLGIAKFLYNCYIEGKRIAYVSSLLSKENHILNRVFSVKSQKEADSEWIDMEILQTELEKYLKK